MHNRKFLSGFSLLIFALALTGAAIAAEESAQAAEATGFVDLAPEGGTTAPVKGTPVVGEELEGIKEEMKRVGRDIEVTDEAAQIAAVNRVKAARLPYIPRGFRTKAPSAPPSASTGGFDAVSAGAINAAGSLPALAVAQTPTIAPAAARAVEVLEPLKIASQASNIQDLISKIRTQQERIRQEKERIRKRSAELEKQIKAEQQAKASAQ